MRLMVHSELKSRCRIVTAAVSETDLAESVMAVCCFWASEGDVV